MAKFIIQEFLTLRTTVEVEAENIQDLEERYSKGEYDEQIQEEQMQWNVVNENVTMWPKEDTE